MILAVIIDEFARHDAILYLRNSIDEALVLLLVIAGAFKNEVYHKHLRLATCDIANALGDLATIIQFCHVNQNNVVIELFHATTILYLIEDVGHGKVGKSLLDGIENREVNGSKRQQPPQE